MSEESQKQTLMLFSVGPVQEFIAQARRTRDLWFGSFLLSELSKAGAKKFQELGGTLIFPVFNESSAESNNAPNKILGEISHEQPSSVARQVKKAIYNKWKEYADFVRGKVDPYIQKGTWNRQVDDLLEFYAVWTEMQTPEEAANASASPYHMALQEVEGLMAARKTLRDFKQNEPGALFGEPKSSLDGGRESVFQKTPQQVAQLAKWGIGEHESLDAISVIKRLSLHKHPSKTFPSVCDKAFAPYQNMLKQNEQMKQAAIQYVKDVETYLENMNLTVAPLDLIEASLFYERRIEDYLEQCGLVGIARTEAKNDITQLLEKYFKGEYSKHNGQPIKPPTPSPYYAFLMADGDKMGSQLRNIQHVESHIAFSKTLSTFASKARGIISKCEGTLIYGGGDDVMAYVPVHQCLEAAGKLQREFVSTMKAHQHSEIPPSISIGIAIVHMLEPLEEVRSMARQAEQYAKQERNSLAIHFQKRGGGDTMNISVSFQIDPVASIQEMTTWLKQSYFTNGFAYGLRELYQTYEQSSFRKQPEILDELIPLEIRRLAFKKKTEAKTEQETKEWIDQLIAKYIPKKNTLEELHTIAECMIIALQLEEVSGHA
ncbi:type III-B CRISPR-associated protein Cas10/Cmr2 [Bacillus safensis]|uniref:type III-B CRISPR-associated protein Cas10/Cmr2 n=1 Tax=Bacillus safensis TaxID=561879 RepID=UPI001D184960|nr:type III-B CRISPR-associated protein Cas10/Cmr2 [Bacillus safensis]MBW4850482.1 type III-B CRISPR-associated protein Cas10/Cmr2 [Bacillaceae bacterium]MBW4852964.1 type III-B CRISPR-associated protein Cas10/Cmr2 [Bacillaceae bacterium]MBW4854996.1 type III-B CRISPR-associated protein Cas10/Cmr2 [Bacillaceae bacterium]UXC33318.1 type III-B CRISPR-associated protein Cas10/Cmr2 [Bacillus safensis]